METILAELPGLLGGLNESMQVEFFDSDWLRVSFVTIY